MIELLEAFRESVRELDRAPMFQKADRARCALIAADVLFDELVHRIEKLETEVSK